jgi:hypothetical protein
LKTLLAQIAEDRRCSTSFKQVSVIRSSLCHRAQAHAHQTFKLNGIDREAWVADVARANRLWAPVEAMEGIDQQRNPQIAYLL